MPFTEQEAERAVTSGSVIGPDRTYTSLPAEASGRSAVRLDAVGEYVEFTLAKPANAMSVRYSVPDNAAGPGISAPVELKLDGTKLKDLDFTSKYSWFYGSYPFTNQPNGDKPHHFYEETRTLFGKTHPNGSADSTAAFQQAVDSGAAQAKEVWIPQGTFGRRRPPGRPGPRPCPSSAAPTARTSPPSSDPRATGSTRRAENKVTIALPDGTNLRHLRLTVTGNTGWPAAQIAELEAYAG